MAITFDHAVKYNGKYYKANTPIEEVKKPWKYEGPETSTEEAAQKAAEAAESASEVEAEEESAEEPKAAQKAAKSRKKGDA